MPAINIMFWNIQNFGTVPLYKANYNGLASAIARLVDINEVDVLFIQELKMGAIGLNHLQQVQERLSLLAAPRNNWYYEWIKGSFLHNNGPWATSAELDWDAAHYEGYAMFWNQNLAKFTMQAPPPVPAAGGFQPNTQSEMVRTSGVAVFGVVPAPMWGVAVPPGGHVVPANPAYTVPAGTVAGPGGIVSGGAVVLGPGPAAPANFNVNGGAVIPAGTLVGAGGIVLNAVHAGRNPAVVPGAFTLTDQLTLPAPGAVVVPRHAMSLVFIGRETSAVAAYSTLTGDISNTTLNFVPGGPNPWRYLPFTRAAGHPASMTGARRPAFVTLDVNMPGAPDAARLTPVICYHAPSAAPASSSGMQRAAYSRPMYQAWSLAGGGGWIDCQRSVLGTDCNVEIDSVAYPYNAFTNPFAAGGANCQIRVANPAPPGGNRAQNPLNQSTVQLTAPPVGGAAIVSAVPSNYKALAIDNVFYRGFAAAQAPPPAPAGLFDMLAGALNAYPPAFHLAPAVLNAFTLLPIVNAILSHLFAGGPAPPPTPELIAPNNLAIDLAVGAFGAFAPGAPPAAREAAEMTRLMISDHLPVLFRMVL